MQLVFIVGVGTAVIGTATAWLVTLCQFPGRRVFEIVLALPLAFPAYVLAYAYTDLLDHPGPVQTALRSVTGWGARDYWFPEIRSLGGAALMLIFVLYPYVYLLSRAAFLRQSPTAYFAARTMGHGPWSAFFRVSLPVARPAIAGGVILCLMETIADFGTVAHFGVQTFATGVYQAWFSMGDRAAASQLAFCLMLAALFLVVLENIQRGGAKHHHAGNRHEAMVPHKLAGWRAAAAVLACLVPVLVGFIIPLVVLFDMAVTSGQSPFSPRYLSFIYNSLLLSSIAAVLTVTAAVLVGYRLRLAPGRAAFDYQDIRRHRLCAAGRGDRCRIAGAVRPARQCARCVLPRAIRHFDRPAVHRFDRTFDHDLHRAFHGGGAFGLRYRNERDPAECRCGVAHAWRDDGHDVDARPSAVDAGEPADGGADRFCRHDEGASGDADPQAVQFRHAGGAGLPAGVRRAAGAGGGAVIGDRRFRIVAGHHLVPDHRPNPDGSFERERTFRDPDAISRHENARQRMCRAFQNSQLISLAAYL